MTSYLPHPNGVEMIGAGGPCVLDLQQVDQLLDIYHESGAVRDFNALFDAAKPHPKFIPRVSSFRAHPRTHCGDAYRAPRQPLTSLERSA